MGVIIKIADFKVAPNAINKNSYQENDLDGFIDLFEKPYLVRILGLELAETYLADCDPNGVPVTPSLQALNNPLQVLYRQKYVSSNGIKSILKGFVRAEWLKELQKTQSPTGVSVTRSENSNAIHESYFHGYNEQIVQAMAVQIYCRNDRDTYPTFKGETLETINPLW